MSPRKHPDQPELFYHDGLWQDASLHNAILDGGDHDKAAGVSRKVAKRLGLSDADIDALSPKKQNVKRRLDWASARAQSAVLLDKFDPNQPRDEDGKWTSGGSGSGAAPSEPPKPPTMTEEEHRFLVSERPSQDKIDKWRKELEARSAELAKEGKAGNDEDNQIGRMQTALNQYMQTSDGMLEREDAGINVVYDVESGSLLGAAFTSVDNTGQIATIETFGATGHNAGLKTLQGVANKFARKVGEIKGSAWIDDGATQAVFEAAGYTKAVGSSGLMVTYVKRDLPGGKYRTPEHGAKILGASQATAKLLDYDPELVSINMGEHPFEVGGRGGYMAAGLAFLETGKIEMFPRQLPTVDAAVNVTAHEVAHQKYETVLKAVADETRDVMNDPDTRDAMNADGSLKPPFDAKYPIYSRFLKHDAAWKQRVKDDGVTAYSTAYWKAAETDKPYFEVGKNTPVRSAEHETIAEIAMLETKTGKVQGKPAWRTYYRDIMKTYDELRAAGKLPARKTPA